MKNKLIKLLTNKDFYEKNRGMVVPEMFPDILGMFYDAIVFAHGKYHRSFSLTELEQIILMNAPLMTRAQKELIRDMVVAIQQEEEIGPDVAKDVLSQAWREEVGRRISQTGLAIIEGKAGITEIVSIIESTSASFLPEDTIKPVTSDVRELLAELDKRVAWKFNIPSLGKVVNGISAGELTIIFGRPEVGKSASHISLACAPGGFCWQGADVHVLVNEEPAVRTMMRCISSASGMTKDQIKEDPTKAATEWNKIRKSITIIDEVGMSMDRLDAYAKKCKPDILIIDQLDKVSVGGAFARKDEMLGEVYQFAREIGKRRNCSVIGLTQASAEAEGKTQLHYSMMAESRTSKAAEADLIIGIGKHVEKLDDPLRFLTLSKNKISGFHGTVHCMLNDKLSRYVA